MPQAKKTKDLGKARLTLFTSLLGENSRGPTRTAILKHILHSLAFYHYHPGHGAFNMRTFGVGTTNQGDPPSNTSHFSTNFTDGDAKTQGGEVTCQ